MTRRSVFRLSGMALLGAVAAPLASLVPKPKPRRFVASVVIERCPPGAIFGAMGQPGVHFTPEQEAILSALPKGKEE